MLCVRSRRDCFVVELHAARDPLPVWCVGEWCHVRVARDQGRVAPRRLLAAIWHRDMPYGFFEKTLSLRMGEWVHSDWW